MADINTCTFTGRLGRDPETRATQSGSVASFSIAVGRKTKNGDETLWLRCSAFGRNADIASQWLKKGSLVGVSGRLSVSEFQNRDGITKQSVELTVNELNMLGGKQDTNSGYEPQASKEKPAEKPEFDDDIPF